VLTAIALGTVFYRPILRVALYAALGTVMTVVTQVALNVALTPFAIPALTAPFVLVTWLFLLPRQRLGEVPVVAPISKSPPPRLDAHYGVRGFALPERP
jgi:urea transporter